MIDSTHLKAHRTAASLLKKGLVARTALAIGYESETAFCTAFRRVIGCSPRLYARTDISREAAANAVSLAA